MLGALGTKTKLKTLHMLEICSTRWAFLSALYPTYFMHWSLASQSLSPFGVNLYVWRLSCFPSLIYWWNLSSFFFVLGSFAMGSVCTCKDLILGSQSYSIDFSCAHVSVWELLELNPKPSHIQDKYSTSGPCPWSPMYLF